MAAYALLGIIVALALIFAFAFLMRMQPVALPRPSGAVPVGRTELALTDTSRTDPFETDGRNRVLAVWIWYPAEPGTAASAAPYLPPAWAPLVSDIPMSQDLNRVSTSSLPDVPLSGRPPVVVLQPGLGQPVASYSTLAEDLASHGYAVIGINETGSAPAVLPDGTVVPATARGGVSEPNVDAWYRSAARVASVWVADAQFIVGELQAKPPSIGPLDFSHIAYVGHSMGGAAAFETCRQDARCAAAIDLDGTLWTDVRNGGLTAPRLLLQHAPTDTCDEFCNRAEADFAKVMNDGDRFSVAGTTHMNFSDAGLMFSLANPVGLGPIDAERMTHLMRATVRSFLDVHVLGEPASEFSATAAEYPELSPVK